MLQINYIIQIIEIIVIFVVGSFAIIIYLCGKNTEKQNAARIIIMEIRGVEKAVSLIKSKQPLNPTTIILPSNSWAKYNHYFVKDFDQDELSIINDFFAHAQTAENERLLYCDFLNIALKEKAERMQEALINLALDDIKNGENNYEQYKKLLADKVHKEDYFFEGTSPKANMYTTINNMAFLTTSSVGQKLKKIAR